MCTSLLAHGHFANPLCPTPSDRVSLAGGLQQGPEWFSRLLLFLRTLRQMPSGFQSESNPSNPIIKLHCILLTYRIKSKHLYRNLQKPGLRSAMHGQATLNRALSRHLSPSSRLQTDREASVSLSPLCSFLTRKQQPWPVTLQSLSKVRPATLSSLLLFRLPRAKLIVQMNL